MNKKLTTVTVVAAFLIGGGVSAASSQAEPAKVPAAVVKTVTVPGPERVVTRDVPGPERIVTKEVTKDVTPDECLTALDLADEAFGYAGEGFAAVADLDVAGISAATRKITGVTPRYQAAKAACRAAG
jgi:hypothetical protein